MFWRLKHIAGHRAKCRLLSGQARNVVFAVPDRKYIEVSGKGSLKLLQGIMTNDANKLVEAGSVLASAFLTPKGRIFADALCYTLSAASGGDGPQVVLEVHRQFHAPMLQHLTMHKLRSAVVVKPLELTSYVSPPGSSATPDPNKGLVLTCVDPRGSEFGTRFLVSSDVSPLNDSSASGNPLDYQHFRLLRGLADTPELSGRIPLECNLDLLNYISFKKGCYVGQELTSRTKFRGLVRKRLQPYILLDLNNEGDVPKDESEETRIAESVHLNAGLGFGLGLFPVDQLAESASIEHSDAVAIAKTAGATGLRVTEVLENSRTRRVLTFRPPFFRDLKQ